MVKNSDKNDNSDVGLFAACVVLPPQTVLKASFLAFTQHVVVFQTLNTASVCTSKLCEAVTQLKEL